MDPTDSSPARRHAAVWLPWLAAPAFAMLPIAGCGAAATLRHAGATTTVARPAAAPPLVPIAAVVTAMPPRR